jgi:signal transduction histidine kinase
MLYRAKETKGKGVFLNDQWRIYMDVLHRLLTSLLKQPLWKSLSFVSVCFVLCLVLYLVSPFYGPLFAIPVALAIWLFQQRGTLISIGLTLFVLTLINTINSRGLLWPRTLVVGLLTGMLALLIEGFFILYLRYLVNAAETASLQVIQAEQQKWREHAAHLETLQAKEHAEAAYKQQRQLNYLKDQFITHVNHELRTPLTGLSGWLEVLGVTQEQGDPVAQQGFLSHASENCEELIAVVDQVLEAVEISGTMKPPQREACQVLQIVQEELAHFDSHETQDVQFQVSISEDLVVWANQRYLRRILRNLLSNAFKYAPQQTYVRISAEKKALSAAESDVSPDILICVQDAGPGIPPAEIPFLFEKFVRLKRDVAASVRGIGLGLYISKQLVEAMGGRIWVESSGQIGEGSQFYFLLAGGSKRE